MKAYAVALALVVIIGFSVIGIIIYNAFPHDSRKRWVVLHTNNMSEADISPADTINGPAVIAGHFAGKADPQDSTIPLADVYVCVSRNKSDSSKTDTILLLDTRRLNGSGDLRRPEYYSTGVKPSKKLNECRVLIPEKRIKRITAYKYKYARVELITDD